MSLVGVLPAKANGRHGERVERGEPFGCQAPAEQQMLPDCVGDDPTGGNRCLQQGHAPAKSFDGHQRGLPGAHTGRDKAGWN